MNPKKYSLELVAKIAASFLRSAEPSNGQLEAATKAAIELLDACAKELNLTDKPKKRKRKKA